MACARFCWFIVGASPWCGKPLELSSQVQNIRQNQEAVKNTPLIVIFKQSHHGILGGKRKREAEDVQGRVREGHGRYGSWHGRALHTFLESLTSL